MVTLAFAGMLAVFVLIFAASVVVADWMAESEVQMDDIRDSSDPETPGEGTL